MFANRDFLNANSLDDAKQKLTSQLIYARRNVIFSGEFSRNLRPENIRIKFFASEFKDEVSFSVTFDKGTTFDASGNLSSQDTSFNIRIVGIPNTINKKTVSLLNNGTFSNSDLQLGATGLDDAKQKFDFNFISSNKTKIFTGDFVDGKFTNEFVKIGFNNAQGAANEQTLTLAFTITIKPGATYKDATTPNDQDVVLHGKITGIPNTINKKSKFFSLDFVKNFLNKLINKK